MLVVVEIEGIIFVFAKFLPSLFKQIVDDELQEKA